MPIDFHLSQKEAGVRDAAASFAHNVLKPVRTEYKALQSPNDQFQVTRKAYAAASAGGLIKGQIPPSLGGTGGSLVETAILVEEFYSVEPAASLTIFGTALGLMPLILTQKPEHREFLAPFLGCEGTPLASLVFSEPGGVANYLEKGAPGLNTTARREGDEWVINGEKKWASNSVGWDNRGADLACVVCRDVTESAENPDTNPKDKIVLIIITRADLERSGDKSFEVVREVTLFGHTAAGPGHHIKYTDVRVPAKNVLCPPGEAAAVVSGAFDLTAVLVGAMSVGIMRAAFDAALAFAKSDDRRGKVPLLERQAVADLLSGMKMQTEACRALTWKAAHAMENGPGDYSARRELALAAKVYCSDAAVKVVTDAINAVGVTAYDVEQPFAELLKNAIGLPIFDGGNVGVRRRHMQELMLSPDYDPWAATYGPSGLTK
ncbi:acyl-CoA dehydrogenase NM domain-like protein [Annulohypoxylon maeteangense]|uniref:acyl-CoA dehydrogenase NM domain-like protein n=1 Tax=Annulohypoxylon maeteangense TaxID=1927788 RepID=UPI002007D77A|nr:acyl-CoA dehydrogenase NM domain-like protein [Annulohypoxylon maeteangense]KAI0885914.1 acyl-CoA dehydrogenase NM domain-like protein [Annulohypoxylon maeteangense]